MEFTLTERTEPFTLEEVFDFIDDTSISKIDAHELKSRIVDVVQDTRNKAIDEFAEKFKQDILERIYDISERQRNYKVGSDMSTMYSHVMGVLWGIHNTAIDEIAEQMKRE